MARFVNVILDKNGTSWHTIDADAILHMQFKQSSGSCWYDITFKGGEKLTLYATPEQMEPLRKALFKEEKVYGDF